MNISILAIAEEDAEERRFISCNVKDIRFLHNITITNQTFLMIRLSKD